MSFKKGDRVEYWLDKSHPRWSIFEFNMKHNGSTGTVEQVYKDCVIVKWDQDGPRGPLPRNIRLLNEPVIEEDWS
jgi:ribosomal protein L21E